MNYPVSVDQPTYSSAKATASFLLGALAITGSVVHPVPGDVGWSVVTLTSLILSIVLGVWARPQIRRGRGPVPGSRLAAWGIGMASVAIACLLFMPNSTNCAGAVPAQARNNLKQIGLALESYRQDHGRFPPAAVYSPDGHPLYSWRVLILPYLEQKGLYDDFDRNQAWDSPHNLNLLARRPAVYDPVGIVADPTMTFDQAFVGPGAAFEGRQGMTLADFPDGSERTLLVVEAGTPVPWTKPVDLPYTAVGQLPALGGIFKGRSGIFAAGRSDGCNVLFADTTVRFIPRAKLAAPALQPLITRNGRDPIDDFEY